MYFPWHRGTGIAFGAALLVYSGLWTPAWAQSRVLIASGDFLPDAGSVTEVLEVALNDAGDWAATVRTDGLDPEGMALVRNGVVLAKAGDILAGITGDLTFQAASTLTLDPAGRLFWRHSAPQAIYRDLEPIVVGGQLLANPDLPPAATVSSILAYAPLADGGAFVGLFLAGQGVQSPSNRVIVRFTPQPEGGHTNSLEVSSGQLYGANNEPLGLFGLTHRGLAVDGQERLAFTAGGTVAGSTESVWRGGERIAAVGEPSSLFGQIYKSIHPNHSVRMNAGGDLSFVAGLGPADGSLGGMSALISNGLVVAQRGQSLPGIFPAVLTGMHSYISTGDDGRVLWYGTFELDGTTRLGLFLDQELLIEQGISGLFGLTFDNLTQGPSGTLAPSFERSPSGTLVALRTALSDGRHAAVLLDFTPTAIDFISGCSQAPLLLCIGSSNPNGPCKQLAPSSSISPGGSISFSIRNNDVLSPSPGSAQALAQLFLSGNALTPCGQLLTGAGELLIDVQPGQPLYVQTLLNLGGFTAIGILNLPATPSLVGFQFFAQAAWVEPPGSGFPPLRLTDAIGFTIGL